MKEKLQDWVKGASKWAPVYVFLWFAGFIVPVATALLLTGRPEVLMALVPFGIAMIYFRYLDGTSLVLGSLVSISVGGLIVLALILGGGPWTLAALLYTMLVPGLINIA